MIGIYKIKNPLGLVYIGQSVNIEKRFIQYKNPSPSQSKIFNSIKKYGYNNHSFEIVEICEINKLNDRERFWQDFYNVLSCGLNCRTTSAKDKSGILSNTTKSKISQSRKGIKSLWLNSEERSLKISNSLTGKKLSEEHKLSLSKAQTGLKRSKEAIKKSVDSRAGFKMPNEAKNKISESQKGGNNSFSKKTINTETNVIYNTAIEAAASIGMSYGSFNHYINGRTKKKIPFKYLQ